MTVTHPVRTEGPEQASAVRDEERAVVIRLSRPHRSGGTVIERAAIMAEGGDSTRLVAWVLDRGGQPEAAAASTKRGLHSPRLEEPGASLRPPLRYVLPSGALD